jgi:RNA polymerase sigma factor (TIGR02999 family)
MMYTLLFTSRKGPPTCVIYNEWATVIAVPPVPSDRSVPGEITSLLVRWNEGDREALSILASLAYEDLRAIAAGYLRRENRGHTLQATALVNELYIRLARQRGVHLTDRRHFYTLAAMMMRRILTDYARQTNALKRPGGESVRVPLHEDLAWVDACSDRMLALDQALAQLEELDERAVRILDLRFFLGCTNDETAGLLDISRATVARDLEYAKTWLYRRLSRPGP